MNKLMKIGTAAASIVATGMLLAPATLADTTCTISGNGANSHNRCTITTNGGSRSCRRLRCASSGSAQSNWANISNTVKVKSSTGGNDANANTGGDVSITTGDSNVNITITNTANP